ncbi:MAG: hypothetical protein Q8L29_00615 [archaeon]|nr:hypothetical protein [archaeon]
MEKISNLEQKELLQKSEISIWLDNYNDIFSVFDSRHYLERALSVDFLDEIKRASRDKPSGGLSLNMLIPIKQRNTTHETLIKKRLKEHFKKHTDILEKDQGELVWQGIYFLFFGLIFMSVAAYILFFYHDKINFFKEFLIVLLEPGGWFLFWEGLALIIFETKKIKPDLVFYRKMSKADLVFHTYK